MSENNNTNETIEITTDVENVEEIAEAVAEVAPDADVVIDDTAEEEPAEEPKPAPARKRRQKAAPKDEEKAEEPKKRGRPKKEELDPGKVRNNVQPTPELRHYPIFTKYLSDTDRVTKYLADLREDPILEGSIVNPDLIFRTEEERAGWERAQKMCDGPYEKDFATIIFLGTDKFGNVDWMIGTKDDDIVRLRQAKSGKITASRVSLQKVREDYFLGIEFDDNRFEHWNLERPADKPQFNLGKKQAMEKKAREEARAKARAEKQEKDEKKRVEQALDAQEAAEPKPARKRRVKVVAAK